MSQAVQTAVPQDGAGAPWWKVRVMWLVVGGPAAVVLGCAITISMALTHPDPVITAQPGAQISADDAADGATAMQPAMKARNNAAADASRGKQP